jgi:ABC-type Fe3+/spermidine/putrescine transport system ATPase subunit
MDKTNNPNPAFLRLADVTKRYDGRQVVDRVSLDVDEGEMLALLGPSGCGKTTTLRLIAGLETPDEGEIWMGDKCVATAGRNLAPSQARGIGFVFQDLALWPHLTVEGNLDFVLAAASMPKRERADRIAEMLRLVRIEPFARSYPGRLSGGEQQRVALARAMIGCPRLLLLDEPMSNLDARLKSELLGEFAVLQQRFRVTTIYVTHDRAEAVALAHHVAFMREGSIKQVCSIERAQAQQTSDLADLCKFSDADSV